MCRHHDWRHFANIVTKFSFVFFFFLYWSRLAGVHAYIHILVFVHDFGKAVLCRIALVADRMGHLVDPIVQSVLWISSNRWLATAVLCSCHEFCSTIHPSVLFELVNPTLIDQITSQPDTRIYICIFNKLLRFSLAIGLEIREL